MRHWILPFLPAVLVAVSAFSQNRPDTTVVYAEDLTHLGQPLSAFRQINEVYNQLYVDNADIGWVTPPYADAFAPNKYVLTADIIPHFFVLASSKYRSSLVITPRVKLRMFDARSLPIRTPSFMPALTYYLRVSDNTRWYKYLTASLNHHSNGQDDDARPNGSFNTRTGNFSTNFIELGYTLGFRVANARICSAKLGFEQYFNSSSELIGRYGFTRLNAKINRIDLGRYVTVLRNRRVGTSRTIDSFTAEKYRFTLEAQWIIGPMYQYKPGDVSRRLNVELKYYRRLRSQYANTYLFGSTGYYGQDPYNIYFNDSYFFARLGLGAGINVYGSGRVR